MDDPPSAVAQILQAVLNAEAVTLRKVVAAILDDHSTQLDVAQILNADDAALADLVSTVLKEYNELKPIRDDTEASTNTRRAHDRLN
ncbi:hypothetical protein GCM10023196_036630 [Actinoallomurus vinaceus]|uniref:Uncharacterized protein n=1 Tax=Actinoallomurus vinaceus TaxID=1080074 RepID=A0ABP8UCF4_9ACTN